MKIEEVLEAAQAKGFLGIAVWSLVKGRYLASVIDREGRIADPRCWDEQPSSEAALTDLKEQLI
ncbi:MAG TPA: hypothetical protein VKI17_11650 [Gemmataceae bacterium]|nr:hypothetical protein [Gemmataceae bacterium]